MLTVYALAYPAGVARAALELLDEARKEKNKRRISQDDRRFIGKLVKFAAGEVALYAILIMPGTLQDSNPYIFYYGWAAWAVVTLTLYLFLFVLYDRNG